MRPHAPNSPSSDGLFRALCAAIEALPESERLVISLRYGEQLTLREIGNILSVTQSRVSRLHGAALRRLRMRTRKNIRGFCF